MRRHPYASDMLAREGSDARAPLLAPSVEFDSTALVTLADGWHDIGSLDTDTEILEKSSAPG
jgi:hypothetical protein